MVTAQDVRLVALTLPGIEEKLIRDRVRFKVGGIVYAALTPDETSMGFAFPKDERASLVACDPEKRTLAPPDPAGSLVGVAL